MVPAERCLVDLGEGEPSALIGVLYMGEVVVEVMVCVIAAGGEVNRGSLIRRSSHLDGREVPCCWRWEDV